MLDVQNGTRSRGFTLIEVLIAILVIALVSVLVSSTVSRISNQTYVLERRQIGQWVGANEITRIRLRQKGTGELLRTGRSQSRSLMGGRDWAVRVEVESTDHPWLQQVSVEVFENLDGEEIGPISVQTAFVGRYR